VQAVAGAGVGVEGFGAVTAVGLALLLPLLLWSLVCCHVCCNMTSLCP
jgi:hypothetical protein